MKIEVTPHRRRFDGRTVYCWQLLDDRDRIRDSGCELTAAAAKRAAQSSIHAQGPDLLLDMLEGRQE